MIAAALEREIEVTGELELAWRALPNRFLAVTGTNGKTTTVELLGHIFRGAGEPVAVAGNVGVPVAGLVGEVEPEATIVCEASSFQLEDTSLFSPEGAVFLNLAPDHLDRHGDLPAYLDAKLRVFANQGNDDVAVWNGDDPELAGVDLGGCARRVEFCRGASPDCEVAAAQGTIFWDGEPLLATSELGIPGEHNVENAMAAAAAALTIGHRPRRGPRRPAQLRRRAAPARAGRRDRRRPLRQRLQGDQRRLRRGRHRQLRPWRPRDPRRQRQGRAVRPAGRAAAPSAPPPSTCSATPPTGWPPNWRRSPMPGVPLTRAADFDDAVRAAAAAAAPGEVVLLSPACASYDAFPNFEARGERFRQIVARARGGARMSALDVALGRARPAKAKKKSKAKARAPPSRPSTTCC